MSQPSSQSDVDLILNDEHAETTILLKHPKDLNLDCLLTLTIAGNALVSSLSMKGQKVMSSSRFIDKAYGELLPLSYKQSTLGKLKENKDKAASDYILASDDHLAIIGVYEYEIMINQFDDAVILDFWQEDDRVENFSAKKADLFAKTLLMTSDELKSTSFNLSA